MARTRKNAGFFRGEERLIAIEEATLGPCAQLSAWATRRHPVESEGKTEELRTAFQRDRDRIVHSRAFRRLKHKTQVFIPYNNDHQRTRLTHTIEVMQLSRTIARCLGLNEDLTEAIALGHDVGHTPFGHVGERTLVQIMLGRDLTDVIPPALVENSGGFKHNAQSVRVVDLLEARYEQPGLNLSDQTREGILKHTGWGKWKDYPGMLPEGLNLEREHAHFEGQVVAVADEIAQQTHDLEDGLRGGVVPFGEVMKLGIVQFIVGRNPALKSRKMSDYLRQNTVVRDLIHLLIVNVVHESARRLEEWCAEYAVSSHADFLVHQDTIDLRVTFSDQIRPMFDELQHFVLERVIRSPMVARNDESGAYFTRELFRIYYEDPTMLAWYALESYRQVKGLPDNLHKVARFQPRDEVREHVRQHYQNDPQFLRLICDYIGGMSNTYAIKEYEKWVMPFPG